MKRILGMLFLIGLMCRMSHALEPVWTSSNTSTADSTQTLCGQFIIGGSSIPLRSIVHEVVVSSAVAGTFQLWNSSWTVASATSTLTIGPIMTGTLGSYFYDTALTQGLVYSKTGTATVQVLYGCYQ
jgi:hypothetical protein